MAGLKQNAIAVQDESGNWLLAPKVRPFTPEELKHAEDKVNTLNEALSRAGVARAEVLPDTPTGPMVRGRSLAKLFGYDVTFIKPNRDFYGVSHKGEAFVSPNTEQPEISNRKLISCIVQNASRIVAEL